MLLSLKQRLIFFLCIATVGFLIAQVAGSLIVMKFGMTTPALRISAVMQSLFQLIIPAIATSVIVTRRPATFLAVDRKINPVTFLLALAGLIAATPAMNLIISLNENMSLPDALRPLENTMRAMEEQARHVIGVMQGGPSIGNLVMNILIIGVLAGFGEELFFRGTLLRLLVTGNVNRHIAIWTVAILFSAMHMQFYGFVPRMLLGAYFGYLFAWSRCLWIPVMIHAANNIIYVCWQWAYGTTGDEVTPFDTLGTNGEWLQVAASIIITTGILIVLYKRRITSANQLPST